MRKIICCLCLIEIALFADTLENDKRIREDLEFENLQEQKLDQQLQERVKSQQIKIKSVDDPEPQRPHPLTTR